MKRKMDLINGDMNKVINRLDITRKDVNSELANNKEELNQKIDRNDNYCVSNFDLIKQHSNKDRNVFQNGIMALKDELSGEMKHENELLQKYVLEVTNKSQKHRDNV